MDGGFSRSASIARMPPIFKGDLGVRVFLRVAESSSSRFEEAESESWPTVVVVRGATSVSCDALVSSIEGGTCGAGADVDNTLRLCPDLASLVGRKYAKQPEVEYLLA